MPTFAFAATVSGLTNEPEQLTRLYAEEFTLVPSEIDGVTSIVAVLDAQSSEDAVHRFDCHLQSATPEITIIRLDEDLVSTTEIAQRVGASRETVRLWAAGKRREGFPPHRLVLTGGLKLWAWADVFPWLLEAGRLEPEEPRPLTVDCIDWYNGHLVTRRREPLAAGADFSSDWHRLPGAPRLSMPLLKKRPALDVLHHGFRIDVLYVSPAHGVIEEAEFSRGG